MTGADERADAGWRLVWSDEFEGEALDASKWTAEESCWGGGNNERQCYTAREANVRVGDGVLHLAAQREPFSGTKYPAHYSFKDAGVAAQDYTSGKIVSAGKADWKYGRISARMKLPPGQGAWSAFWMMPADSHYGEWPLSGEIDIMEAVNLDTSCEACAAGVERRTSGAVHFGDTFPHNAFLTAKNEQAVATSPSDEWRVYTIEWAEGVIQWFVDGQIFMRVDQSDWRTGAENAAGNPYAPFDRRFYLNLNLAVGGNLPEKSNGAGFDPETFPAELLVDWVRVEQCASDVETGRACLSKQGWDGALSGAEN